MARLQRCSVPGRADGRRTAGGGPRGTVGNPPIGRPQPDGQWALQQGKRWTLCTTSAVADCHRDSLHASSALALHVEGQSEHERETLRSMERCELSRVVTTARRASRLLQPTTTHGRGPMRAGARGAPVVGGPERGGADTVVDPTRDRLCPYACSTQGAGGARSPTPSPGVPRGHRLT